MKNKILLLLIVGMFLINLVNASTTVRINATTDGEESIAVKNDPTGYGQNSTFQAKFDISSIPLGNQIESVTFNSYLWVVSGSGSFETDIYNVINQSWDRSLDCAAFLAQTLQSESSETWSSTDIETWSSVDVASQFSIDYDLGNQNTTFRFESTVGDIDYTPDDGCTDYNNNVELILGKSDYGSGDPLKYQFRAAFNNLTYRPYLNITYSEVESPPEVSSFLRLKNQHFQLLNEGHIRFF